MERVGLGFEEKLNVLLAEAKKKKNVLDYLFEFYSTFPNILSNLFY